MRQRYNFNYIFNKAIRIEKQPIAYPKIPLRLYNYSYVGGRLLSIYGKKVSAPTIISIK